MSGSKQSKRPPSLIWAGATDRGQMRDANEDRFLATPDVLAVADGMGGHAAGEVAAGAAVDTLARLMRGSVKRDPEELMTAAIREANQIILERGAEYEQLAGMGTTATAAVVRRGLLTVAHVGDSRAYLFRGGELQQLTEDHSLVGELVRRGRLTAEEAAVHPQRAVITRALGSTPDLDVDIVRQSLEPGDILLLATDGLTGVVPDEMIATTMSQALATGTSLSDLCSRLIAQANVRGGPDNITVVVAEYLGSSEPAGSRRTVWRPAVVVTLVFLLVVALAGLGGYRYWSRSYYLGFAGEDLVLYQGLPGSLVGIRLSRVYRRTAIHRDELPGYYQERLTQGIPITDTEEADRIISEIVLTRQPLER